MNLFHLTARVCAGLACTYAACISQLSSQNFSSIIWFSFTVYGINCIICWLRRIHSHFHIVCLDGDSMRKQIRNESERFGVNLPFPAPVVVADSCERASEHVVSIWFVALNCLDFVIASLFV